MSCPHGNHEQECGQCEAEEAKYDAGFKAGVASVQSDPHAGWGFHKLLREALGVPDDEGHNYASLLALVRQLSSVLAVPDIVSWEQLHPELVGNGEFLAVLDSIAARDKELADYRAWAAGLKGLK